jgi:hypothetical protein
MSTLMPLIIEVHKIHQNRSEKSDCGGASFDAASDH